MASTIRAPFLVRFAAQAALLLGACSNVGCSGGEGAKASDAGAEAGAATFTAIYNDILTGSCAQPFCHLGSLAPTMPLPDQATAYMQMVNAPAAGANCSGMGLIRVVPGHPETSLLYNKITSQTPECGGAMPKAGQSLAASDIARIKEWILAGAKND
jgi:hypothetical protein